MPTALYVESQPSQQPVRKCYYSHLRDEETEALSTNVLGPKSQRLHMSELEFNSDLFIPRARVQNHEGMLYCFPKPELVTAQTFPKILHCLCCHDLFLDNFVPA